MMQSVSGKSGFRAGARSPGFGGIAEAVTLVALVAAVSCLTPGAVRAQEEGATAPRTLTVAAGNSTVLDFPANLQRLSLGDPNVADAVVVSARELVINGKEVGSTTLLTWLQNGQRRSYAVKVIPDAEGLERDLARYFPEQEIHVSATGGTLVLSGTVTDPQVAEKALELAENRVGEGGTVLDNVVVPDRGQILLKVRFAEVNRSAMRDLGVNFLRAVPEDPFSDDIGAIGPGGIFSGSPNDEAPTGTLSDAVNFYLFHEGSSVSAFVEALQTRGLFRSLAEPNLLAVPGDSASFLAGGEFPFPVVQGGGGGGATSVTIQFREFGIRLGFRPTITNSGAIRLKVAPEVSQLDFSQGLQVSGFNVPAILSRRAETTIELRDGQTFAIAGLMDNSWVKNTEKVPFLGDIPILGALFRSESLQQNRTELLVLVTPHLVQPTDEEPAVPTGEPEEWDWSPSMRDWPPAVESESGTGGN